MGELLAPEIADLIDHRQTGQARAALIELREPEIADVLICLEPKHQAIALRLLPRQRAAEVFSYFDQDDQERIVGNLTNEQAAQIINEMDPDDRVDFLEDAPDELAKNLLALMQPEERAETEKILEYPEESIGREMTPEYLTVRPEWTVAEALRHIREHGDEAESLNIMYVVDEQGKLLDFIKLRKLLLADPAVRCETLREGQVVSLRADDDREKAVRVMERYDLPVLPVVDKSDELVGIVTFDDVADVAEEEATEDMQKMGGMEALDEPYMTATLASLVHKRGIWLIILFVGETFTASAMSYFEVQIQKAVVLALFIPLIISSGGNSGSQATSLIIRAMALGEVTLKMWWKVLWRELACGLLLGILLGVVGLVRVIAWQQVGLADYTSHFLLISLTVASTLVGVVTFGTLVGGMLPFVLRRVGLDPATASAPFVATLVDVTGLVIYFTMAILFLRGTLL
ncbi:MAG: magnesium transporter [Planctomycetes bacterium]|nr:magnesium transporter [Planctomycetota bacterium]